MPKFAAFYASFIKGAGNNGDPISFAIIDAGNNDQANAIANVAIADFEREFPHRAGEVALLSVREIDGMAVMREQERIKKIQAAKASGG